MILELGVTTTSGVTAEPCWEIRTGSTPGQFRLMELGFTLVAATASKIGLGRPAAIGVTPTTPVDFQLRDTNDVLASGALQSALAWATKPTIPAQFFKVIGLPATIGAGVIWEFGPEGLTIPVSSSLVLWNMATNSVLNAYAVVAL